VAEEEANIKDLPQDCKSQYSYQLILTPPHLLKQLPSLTLTKVFLFSYYHLSLFQHLFFITYEKQVIDKLNYKKKEKKQENLSRKMGRKEKKRIEELEEENERLRNTNEILEQSNSSLKNELRKSKGTTPLASPKTIVNVADQIAAHRISSGRKEEAESLIDEVLKENNLPEDTKVWLEISTKGSEKGLYKLETGSKLPNQAYLIVRYSSRKEFESQIKLVEWFHNKRSNDINSPQLPFILPAQRTILTEQLEGVPMYSVLEKLKHRPSLVKRFLKKIISDNTIILRDVLSQRFYSEEQIVFSSAEKKVQTPFETTGIDLSDEQIERMRRIGLLIDQRSYSRLRDASPWNYIQTRWNDLQLSLSQDDEERSVFFFEDGLKHIDLNDLKRKTFFLDDVIHLLHSPFVMNVLSKEEIEELQMSYVMGLSGGNQDLANYILLNAPLETAYRQTRMDEMYLKDIEEGKYPILEGKLDNIRTIYINDTFNSLTHLLTNQRTKHQSRNNFSEMDYFDQYKEILSMYMKVDLDILEQENKKHEEIVKKKHDV
jgi:hypothetical protein